MDISPEQLHTSPESFKSTTRTDKIDRALGFRQPTLTVVLENVHDPHNVNAILRSCDAVGVLSVHFLYTIEKFPRLAHGTSSGAYKWLDYHKWKSVAECFEYLKSSGHQVLATKLEPGARELYDFELTRPTAFVLGNEHRGISEEAAKLCDELLYIPMLGMVESLNVSVATAVTLFEASRQRRAAGLYDAPQLTPEALRSKRLEWLLR
jgi:tRNA (guanosine-2'-O-)-methyltransferase